MKIENIVAAAMEPVVDLVLAVEKQIADIQLKAGPAGKDGPTLDEVVSALRADPNLGFLKAVDENEGRRLMRVIPPGILGKMKVVISGMVGGEVQKLEVPAKKALLAVEQEIQAYELLMKCVKESA